jgi:hypothetical protein
MTPAEHGQETGPTLLRLRATIVPFNSESAAIAIHLPATLYTLRFPNEVEVNLQTYWANVTGDAEVTVRFVTDDGSPCRADAQLVLQREGQEWRAACIEAVLFQEPGSVSLVVEHEGREIERRLLEMKSGTGRPYRP